MQVYLSDNVYFIKGSKQQFKTFSCCLYLSYAMISIISGHESCVLYKFANDSQDHNCNVYNYNSYLLHNYLEHFKQDIEFYYKNIIILQGWCSSVFKSYGKT